MSDLTRLFNRDHPFISEPDDWIIVGHGMNSDLKQRIPMEGRSKISHRDGKIVNEGTISIVSASNPVTLQSRYELTPTETPSVLSFYQENESVGDLEGEVVAFYDRLISIYHSGDGSLAGSEVFIKMSENRYTVTGSLTRDGKILNLWKLDMVRQSEEASMLEDKKENEEGV
jgi:hypothetical protein